MQISQFWGGLLLPFFLICGVVIWKERKDKFLSSKRINSLLLSFKKNGYLFWVNSYLLPYSTSL